MRQPPSLQSLICFFHSIAYLDRRASGIVRLMGGCASWWLMSCWQWFPRPGRQLDSGLAAPSEQPWNPGAGTISLSVVVSEIPSNHAPSSPWPSKTTKVRKRAFWHGRPGTCCAKGASPKAQKKDLPGASKYRAFSRVVFWRFLPSSSSSSSSSCTPAPLRMSSSLPSHRHPTTTNTTTTTTETRIQKKLHKHLRHSVVRHCAAQLSSTPLTSLPSPSLLAPVASPADKPPPPAGLAQSTPRPSAMAS
ncbi:uncharacterized protein B0I36DRAFT_350808 [Microdochium trichocladiopsis]|uniref:Uncharacterized protein n=1 Tax=Microdochium trichocladiopsis TaxID=1682393 RepID=A0A9P8Y120_9PEZI|nr:uncharacterized protein B0I36DRAFT_350808 [Microdochium trichocladiopsis]KAH7027242.1 hypothetical protein B0I36DRAFT_350808 [Microdochium trichocladiopsis]